MPLVWFSVAKKPSLTLKNTIDYLQGKTGRPPLQINTGFKADSSTRNTKSSKWLSALTFSHQWLVTHNLFRKDV